MAKITHEAHTRWILIAISTAAYLAAYVLLHHVVGSMVSALVSLPVALAAWWYGLRTGLISLVIAIVANGVLMVAIGGKTLVDSSLWTGEIFGMAVLAVFTVALGTVHGLSEQLRSELAKRQESEQTERRHGAELQAVYNASLALNSSLELKPVLSAIMQQITVLMHTPEVHIFLYDGEQLTFGLAYWNGREQHEPLRIPRENGFTLTIARTGQRMIVNDVSVDPFMGHRGWTGSVIGLPLAMGEQVYGVMNVGFGEPRQFSESELQIVQLFANQAAQALRNARAYETTRQYAVTLEKRVAERTAALQSAKESAEALLNNSFDIILRLDVAGVILENNLAFVRVFGIREGKGLRLASLFMDSEKIDVAIENVATKQAINQLEATALSDGGEFTTDLVFVPLKGDGGGLEILCNLRDVTERKRAEMRQQALVQGQRKVLALTYELISSPDIDSLWKLAVEKARSVLGVERCSIFVARDDFMVGTYGTNMRGETTDERRQMFVKGKRSWERLEYVFSLDTPAWHIEQTHLQEWDGESMNDVSPGWVGVTPIHSAYRFIGLFYNDTGISGTPPDEIQQEILSMFCTFLGSLYEHKRVEDEIRRMLEREKELNELKTRFTTMISHELRTPLSSIQLSTDLLKRYADRMDTVAMIGHIDKIQGQVKHLTSLLEDVLTLSRAESTGLQPLTRKVDLRSFCAELVDELQVTYPTHRIMFMDRAGVWAADADTRLLRQALMNLMLNAVKYSAEGSLITLSLERDGGDAVFKISDQGIGIPEVDLPHVFEVFYRARNVGAASGTGVGLALVRQIADAHRGQVECVSEVGSGTTFIFRFPAFS